MVRQQHQLNGHEFEEAPRDSETGKAGILQSMGSQRVGQDLLTKQQLLKGT